MKRALLAVVVLVTAPRAGHAGELAPDKELAEISTLIDQHRSGEAYWEVSSLCAAYPDDPNLRGLAATAAINLWRLEDARAQLAAGLAAHPNNASLLGLSSWLFFATGDPDAARRDAEYALTIDGSERDAQEVVADLDVFARAADRARMGESDLLPDTARWTVDHLFERLLADAPSEELAESFDPTILDGIPADRRPSLVAFLDEVRGRAFDPGGLVRQRRLGWIVVDASTRQDGSTDVDVSLPWVYTMSGDPSWAVPGSLAALDSVEADEREAARARIVGRTITTVAHLRFELVPTGSAYRIYGVLVNGVDVRTLLDRFLPPRHESPSWLPYAIGLAIAAVAGVALGVLISLSGRRGPGRANRRS